MVRPWPVPSLARSLNTDHREVTRNADTSDPALSPLHAGMADAVRLGADAVGYTLYVGTPAAEVDFAQYPR